MSDEQRREREGLYSCSSSKRSEEAEPVILVVTHTDSFYICAVQKSEGSEVAVGGVSSVDGVVL